MPTIAPTRIRVNITAKMVAGIDFPGDVVPHARHFRWSLYLHLTQERVLQIGHQRDLPLIKWSVVPHAAHLTGIRTEIRLSWMVINLIPG